MSRKIIGLVLLAFLTTQAGCAISPLSSHAINGDVQGARELIDKGEDVNKIDKWGWTPLMWSVYYGNFPVTKLLLEKGADPNIRSELAYGAYLPGTTVLILAASYGHDDAVQELLKRKADPNVVDRKGKKAIDYAEEYGFHKCVALLKRK